MPVPTLTDIGDICTKPFGPGSPRAASITLLNFVDLGNGGERVGQEDLGMMKSIKTKVTMKTMKFDDLQKMRGEFGKKMTRTKKKEQ